MQKRSVLVLVFAFILCLAGCGKEAATIGIIGGADGPTAIFVASGTGGLNPFGLIGLTVVTALAVGLIWRSNKKK